MSETDWLTLLPQYATLVALFLTALALFFNGYVWWATNRDKKIRAIRRINGELNYLWIKKAHFNGLSKEQQITKVQEFKDICEKVADDIAIAMKYSGAIITPHLGKEAMNFSTKLHQFSQRDVERNLDALIVFNEEWDGLFKELVEFFTEVNREIESHKFRCLLKNLLKSDF
jgi:hypothetical protein